MNRVYGLLGRKLGHSYSVPIHRALGNEAYALFEREPETLGEFFSQSEVAGLNVTIPYKRDVMAYCDALDETAREIGSGGSGNAFTHSQVSAATLWTINHNLGFRPAVAILDSGGNEIEADVVHTGPNQLVIYFAIPVAGVARLT